MPCFDSRKRTDGLNWTARRSLSVLDHLIELGRQLGIKPSDEACRVNSSLDNDHLERRLDQFTAELCSKMKLVTPYQMQILIKDAPELLKWWDRHQKDDAGRAEWDAEEESRMAIVREAMAKLTAAERQALGLGTEPRRFQIDPD